MTLNTAFATSQTLGIDFTQIFHPSTTGYPYASDVPTFAPGTITNGTNGSTWVWVKFGTGGLTGVGYVVVIDTNFGAVMMSNSVGNKGDSIGVGNGVAVANDYGWVQTGGACAAVQVATLCAANAALASTATAGVLDDAVGAGTKNIGNLFTIATNAGGTTAPEIAEMNSPTVGTTN